MGNIEEAKEARAALERAGYTVAPAEDVPGLFDVSSVGELTINQLIDLAKQKGHWPAND
jgi:hypothetical protein|tara:strand:+ start:4525 stop:4701 length:177 start_codon:yes stop_codon:yes gene_type:complete